jgi:hypothetical protein
MFKPDFRAVMALAAALMASAAVASQPSTSSSSPSSGPSSSRDPLDAKAAVPLLVHRSSLSSYRSAHDVRVGSWREANDTVTRIGGWRVYTRETESPVPGGGAHQHGPR